MALDEQYKSPRSQTDAAGTASLERVDCLRAYSSSPFARVIFPTDIRCKLLDHLSHPLLV